MRTRRIEAMAQTCLIKFARAHGSARVAVRRLLQEGIDARLDGSDVVSTDSWRTDRSEKKPTRLRTWALSGAAIGFIAGASLAIDHRHELSNGERRHADRGALDRRPHHLRNDDARSSSGDAGGHAGGAAGCRISRTCPTTRAWWMGASFLRWRARTTRGRQSKMPSARQERLG